ncbi:MAG: ABC transporter ATP-binding protein [Acidimicrobiia bacterium]|nr:ABC transporter ATP-binding protein [Acidimicrobiia bacterium]
MLEVSGLHAGYGPIEVLHGLDFTVQAGEMVVILGANGAGKTTTMLSLSGVLARRGSLVFDGHDISRASPDAIVAHGIAQVPQGRGTFTDLTVEDNLLVGAYLRKDPLADDLDRWYTTFPRLAERRTQKAGSLSGGEQQMLAIARALMSRPRLLLCDEPSQGLAPIIVQEMFRILQRLNEEDGTAVLLVEQNANLAMDIANRAYVLETGSIVASGDAASLRDDDSVRKAYLGY